MKQFNLSKWIATRRENRRLEIYFRGYDYAAGILLREGGIAIDRLLNEADSSFDRNSFDLGIEAAVRAYERKQDAI